MTATLRDTDVIGEARRYLGTPYEHTQRRRGVAIDCIGLLVCTSKSLGYHVVDQSMYPRLPDGRLIPWMNRFFDEGSRQRPRFADIGVFWFDRNSRAPQHVGIFVPGRDAGLAVIHAYADVGRCVQHEMSKKWRRRLVTVYRFRGIERTLGEPASLPSR